MRLAGLTGLAGGAVGDRTGSADAAGAARAAGDSNHPGLGIAAREGHPISFWEFTRKDAIVTALTIAIAAPYLWLRYFVLA